jgi:hypothetical protein
MDGLWLLALHLEDKVESVTQTLRLTSDPGPEIIPSREGIKTSGPPIFLSTPSLFGSEPKENLPTRLRRDHSFYWASANRNSQW